MRLKKSNGKMYVLKSAASTGPRKMLADSQRWFESVDSIETVVRHYVPFCGCRLTVLDSMFLKNFSSPICDKDDSHSPDYDAFESSLASDQARIVPWETPRFSAASATFTYRLT